MILFTIIFLAMLSSLLRPRYYHFYGPRFYHRPYGFYRYHRGPRMMGPMPRHIGPRRF